jgi:polyphosphate kinase 2 (PPK2 family)
VIFSLAENYTWRIEKELPSDGKVGGFDRGSAGLFMDEGQLSQYMPVAEMVFDEAVFNEKPKVQKFSYDGPAERYVHGLHTA